jgi:type VI protein secretion system component VasK
MLDGLRVRKEDIMLAADTIGFWQGFFLLLIWIPLVMIWVFVLMDLFRREDVSGWTKALWVVVIIIIPFFGSLIYLIFRPVTKQDIAMGEEFERQREYQQAANTTDKLAKLSELLDKGHITQEEFDRKKAKLMQ